MLDKVKDLAGPGISTYEEVARVLPEKYESLLDRKETQKAIYDVKEYIEKGLAKELNLTPDELRAQRNALVEELITYHGASAERLECHKQDRSIECA